MSWFRDLWNRVRLSNDFKKEVQLEVVTPPILFAVKAAFELFEEGKNKYEQYMDFCKIDPELWSAINRIALMVAYSYHGVTIRPGTKLEQAEIDLLTRAQEGAEKLQLRQRFYTSAFHLLRDGDDVYALKITKGLTQVQPLPMKVTTAVTEETQINNSTAQILEPEIYVINEQTTAKLDKFQASDVLHLSLSNLAEEVRDNIGRYTLGVWSISPLESLRARIYWKTTLVITDMLLRYRNVPREHHKLPMTQFDPSRFAGDTWEARVTAAQTAAQTALKAYADTISQKKVDQGYITDDRTKIDFIQPSVSYTAPNDLLKQLDESIYAAIGAPLSAVGRVGGTYAAELVIASYAVMTAEYLAAIIAPKWLDCLKRYLAAEFDYKPEELAKLQLKVQLILEVMRSELTRQIAVLNTTEAFTKDELREMLGYNPLTDEQKSQIETEQADKVTRGRVGDVGRTKEDIVGQYIRRDEPGEHLTPESRADRQAT